MIQMKIRKSTIIGVMTTVTMTNAALSLFLRHSYDLVMTKVRMGMNSKQITIVMMRMNSRQIMIQMKKRKSAIIVVMKKTVGVTNAAVPLFLLLRVSYDLVITKVMMSMNPNQIVIQVKIAKSTTMLTSSMLLINQCQNVRQLAFGNPIMEMAVSNS